MSRSLTTGRLARFAPLTLALTALAVVVAFTPATGASRPATAPRPVAQVTVQIPITTWTTVASLYPSQSNWTTNRDAIRVGRDSTTGSGNVWRALMQADIGQLQGKTIVNASILGQLFHTWSCNPSPVQLWSLNTHLTAGTPVTWTNSQSYWSQIRDTRSAVSYPTGCAGPVALQFQSTGLINDLVSNLNANKLYYSFGLRAQTETDSNSWKKFTSDSFILQVTYEQ